MKKVTKKLLSSVLAISTLALSALTCTFPVSAEVVTVTYGDYNRDGKVDGEDAKYALEYIREMDGPKNTYGAIAAGLGLAATTASNVSRIYKKAADPTYEFPNGDTVEADIAEATSEAASEGSTEATTGETADPNKATVFVLGDSTGASFNDTSYYYPRVGFGVPLKNYFNSDLNVVNLALSGRSSKSFVNDNEYTQYINQLKSGDYVLIAFGHNDQKTEAERFTDPNGNKDTEGSFQHSLYTNYVKPALDKGATPILCTPIVRRTETETWSDSKLHITATTTVNGVTYPGGDYAKAIRDLAAELNLAVVDNTVLTKNLYDELTPSKTINLHAWTSFKDSSVDNTHLNNYGANYVAYLMADALAKSTSPLGKYVKTDNKVPDEATYLVVNPDYVMPSTDDPTGDALISQFWSTTSPFYGSVFGDIGGAGKITPDVIYTNFNISETKGSDEKVESVNLRAGALGDNGKISTSLGKISANTDGMVLYYQHIAANDDFQLSGKMKINSSIGGNTQVSFGAIILDSIKVDEYAAEGYNYVSAGVWGNKEGRSITFARTDGVLASNSEATLTEAVPDGTEVNLSIIKNGNEFTATYGDVTAKYTMEMTDTAYAGFYVSRAADVTVSNITYTTEVVK